MDKTAQKRGPGAKLRETLDWPARSAEKFFKPEFEKVMKSLVAKDDAIRSTLLGKRYGTPEAGVTLDGKSAKDLLRETKSLINRREYISAVSSLAQFHRKMQEVANIVDKLQFDVSKIHHQFLFGKKIPEKRYMEHLTDLESRIASQEFEIIKQAGLVDTLRNMFSERGRALRAWEKRYEETVGPLRDATKEQLAAAESLLNTVLEQLKIMASLRAARKIDAYVEAAKNIKREFETYDNGKGGFRNFYNTHVRKHIENQRKQLAEQTTSTNVPPVEVGTAPNSPSGEKITPVDVGPTGTINAPPLPQVFEQPLTTGVTGKTVPGVAPQGGIAPAPGQQLGFPGAIAPDSQTQETPERSKLDEVHEQIMREMTEKQKNKTATQRFLDSLEVYSSEHPAVLAVHISKYARSIQAENPVTAIQLFKVAKSLRG